MTNEKKRANETLETIASRRSVRFFDESTVSEEDVQLILEAANHAPSAHNQQSWKFIIVEGEVKSGLANLVSSRSGDFTRPSSVLLRMAARSIISAPVVIAVVNTGKLVRHGNEMFQINKEKTSDLFRVMEIESSAAAVQNLLLAATSLGLASVWLGILMLIKDDILHFLGEPTGEFMAVIPVGYALKSMHAPHKQPLEKVIKRLR